MGKARRRRPEKKQKSVDRSSIRFAAIVFLLAVIVRGIYLHDSRDNPTFSAPVVDSLTYDLMARGVVEGSGITSEFFWQHFFYPIFLSIVYLVSNSSIICAKVIQILLGSVTCVLIYRLGERIFSRKSGVVAGLIAALYGPLIFFEAELLAAGWAAFWAAVLILLLLETAEKKSVRLCFALGLCAALSVITRPNFVPFLLAACVWLAAVWIRGRASVKKSAIALLVLIAGFCTVTISVAAQNYRVTGRFSFLPGSGGLNLYIGNNPEFEAVALRPGREWSEVVSLPSRQGLYTAAERQRFFYGKTFEYMREQPAGFLKGLARKGAEFTSSREMPGNIDVYLFRRWSRLLGLLVWKVDGFGFPFGVLLPLALLGLSVCWRKVPVPVVLFLVFYPASVILTHIEARYRMPVIIPMCILAGAGLVRVAELVRLKRWRYLAAAGIFCAAVGFLCSIAGPFYSEQHVNYEAELYYGLGDSLDKQGRVYEAIEAYSNAISLRGDYTEAYHNLGLLLVKQKRLREAIAYYNTALQVDPENAGLHEDLGVALFEQGKVTDAIKQYRRAIQIDAEKASAHDNLGRALYSLNRISEAHKHFSKAIELDPYDPVTHNNIGSLLAMQGKLHKAVEHFEKSLSIRPENPDTLNNLASALAGLSMFEEALEKFEEAVRIAPDDAGIYFNLGWCLQQQGQVDKAVEAYRKALAIEPGHPGARRALEELAR